MVSSAILADGEWEGIGCSGRISSQTLGPEIGWAGILTGRSIATATKAGSRWDTTSAFYAGAWSRRGIGLDFDAGNMIRRGDHEIINV